MKYNYIIFNMGADYFQCISVPLKRSPFVLVHRNGCDGGRLANLLFFFHWSKRVNQYVRLPFKQIWFNSIYHNNFNNKNPLCFVFLEGKYISESNNLREFILKKNPSNKCIVYYTDNISKRNIDIIHVKTCSDAIVTYDPVEAQKYGIFCYDKPVYGRIAPLTTPNFFDYDVFFLGFAKDRLNLIREVFEILTTAGLKCKFIVCGVKREDRQDDGIEYRGPITYDENLTYVNRSKCVLEIIQGGSATGTLRRSEAIVYKRKLLTNNIGMKEEDYFNTKNMSVFSSPEDINIDFIKQPIDYSAFPDEDEFSPDKLLEFFDEILEEKSI